MFKVSDFKKISYKTGEVAKILSVTPRTIYNYDKSGTLKISRSKTNRRVILKEDLLFYLNSLGQLYDDLNSNRVDIIYARVSSQDQRQHGDLDRQALFLLENAPSLQNPLILKEVGSGLNDKRPLLKKLLNLVMSNKVRNVYITYKDRLTRFGFSYLEAMFASYNTNIISLQQQNNDSIDCQLELVEDMMSLVASFSGKLYGMRSRKNKVNKKEK